MKTLLASCMLLLVIVSILIGIFYGPYGMIELLPDYGESIKVTVQSIDP